MESCCFQLSVKMYLCWIRAFRLYFSKCKFSYDSILCICRVESGVLWFDRKIPQCTHQTLSGWLFSFLSFFFVLMCIIFKVFIEFVTTWLLFFLFWLFLATRHVGLSSLIRDWIHTPCTGNQSLKTTGPPGTFLVSYLI